MLAADKTFDGTTAATVSHSVIDGVIARELVTLSRAGKFADASVGADKIVIFQSALIGKDKSNHGLPPKGGTTMAEILAP